MEGGCTGSKKCLLGKNYCNECNEENNVCNECEIGFYPDNNGGCSYIENCEISHNGHCLKCQTDYYLIGNEFKICKYSGLDDFQNCKEINYTTGFCSSCEEGYFLNSGDNRCTSIEHCYESSYGICTKCSNSYYLDKSKDECLRGCYSYSIHLLEITYNLNCNSKFNKINEEYKNNKPCYKASPEMQNVLDNGNAYVDLFCAKDEESKPCPFITDIVKIPDNSTIIEKVCKTPENERKQCDKSLIQNLSVMIDAKGKLGETEKATYSSGGLSISLNTPNYDTDKIKAQLENNTCLAKVEPPKQILVKANDTNKNGTESAATNIMMGRNLNTFVVLITVALVALLF